MGESTTTPIIVVLLDWGKAVDKVSQVGLLVALGRMSVEENIIRVKQVFVLNKSEFQGGGGWGCLGVVWDRNRVLGRDAPLSILVCST